MSLHIDNLTTGYRGKGKIIRRVSQNLQLSLEPGEVVALIGPNGVGKSTLFRTIAGVQPALEGTILLDNTPLDSYGIRDRAKKISLVFTGRPQTNFVTVEEIISLGRYPHTGVRGKLSAKDRERVAWAMDALGVTEFRNRYTGELSDGELQKVMVARALAQDTDIMILDEPAAFLDVGHRIELMGLLRSIAEEVGRTILISSHDLELVYYVAHRVWLMGRDSSVVQGAPEDIMTPSALGKVFIQNQKNRILLKKPKGEGINLYEIYKESHGAF